MATFVQNQEINTEITTILKNISRPMTLELVPVQSINSLRSEYEQVIRPNTLDKCKTH